MKAMIFAAGVGKRLGELTLNLPKALIEINGKTVLRLAVEKLAANGFDDIIVNVHYLADMVEQEIESLRKSGFTISVSDERENLLETGGGLNKARWFFNNNPFLLYNTDIVTDLDLTSLYRFHLKKKGIASLAVRIRPGNRFFLIDRDGVIKGWRNTATGEEIITDGDPEGLTEAGFSGIHIVNPEIFNYMKDGVYTMTTLYLQLPPDQRIYSFSHDDGFWVDIGTKENLEIARKYFRKSH